MTPPEVSILPVTGLPEIAAGDNLAAVIDAAVDLRDRDVVVVAQKIVSKSEGATVRVADVMSEDSAGGVTADRVADARRRLARSQADGVIVDSGDVLIVRTKHGLVCANGGIDASNASPGTLILLPEDPDASAERLRAGLAERSGADVAIVVTDTFGRPWRVGQTDVAIGVAGIRCIRDEHGAVDRAGRRLEATQVAVVDEIAAAADLVRRKADGVPVVVVRGVDWDSDTGAHARQLVRDPAMDLFPRGRGELARVMRGPASLRPLDEKGLQQAIESARTVAGNAVRFEAQRRSGTVRIEPQMADGAPEERSSSGTVPAPSGEAAPTAVAIGAAAALLFAVLVDAGYAARLQLDPWPVVTVSEAAAP